MPERPHNSVMESHFLCKSWNSVDSVSQRDDGRHELPDLLKIPGTWVFEGFGPSPLLELRRLRSHKPPVTGDEKLRGGLDTHHLDWQNVSPVSAARGLGEDV
ncbi:MAG: hypothetical protein MK102_04925 [Fuerstiella sp.]|nr:hypothetical protein [Fuerstiella sp.]